MGDACLMNGLPGRTPLSSLCSSQALSLFTCLPPLVVSMGFWGRDASLQGGAGDLICESGNAVNTFRTFCMSY